ncbi:MAG: M14 family zinc carboxypeptidase [Gemmatimonadota bacterium]
MDEVFLLHRYSEIVSTEPVVPGTGRTIGESVEGRPIEAYRLGSGPHRVSLLAGCHADEPVGPALLRHLVGFLTRLPAHDDLRRNVEWWIVPHVNPDGEQRNRGWQVPFPEAFDPVVMLQGAVRELPGDDLEFGFPRDELDDGARPECRALYDWWRESGGAFDMHVSLHGMGFGAGPWFLLEPGWIGRTRTLRETCRRRTLALGYELHDVERSGEKGFHRIERGFCTRPDSGSMRAHFLDRDDPETASRFRPSSMETVRALGGDPLTLVSEMPLFLTPGVGTSLGPPDPELETWKRRIAAWREALSGPDPDRERIATEMRSAGLRSMPVRDQMELQWTFIAAGLIEVGRSRSPGGWRA